MPGDRIGTSIPNRTRCRSDDHAALAIVVALAIAAPPAASASTLTAAQQSYLTLAWHATLQAYSLWWDHHSGWYRQTLDSRANLLQTDAATISVFAWLAASPAP